MGFFDFVGDLPVVGDLLGVDSTADRAGKQQKADVRATTAGALANMTPEAINALVGQFLPQIMARMSPMLQTQVQGLQSSLGQRGLGESGIGATAEAGLRSGSVNQAAQQAFMQAMQQAQVNAQTILGQIPGLSQANQMIGNQPTVLQQGSQIAGMLSSPFGMAGLTALGIPGGGGSPAPGAPIGGNFSAQFPAGGQFPSGFGSR